VSHISEVSLELKDLDALEAACKAVGLEFVRGVQKYKWFGRFVGDSPLPPGVTEEELGKCDHVCRIPGNARAYEIGIARKADGTYVMRYDFWSGGYGLEAVAGKNCGRLAQEYAAQVAIKRAKLQGFSVQRKQLQDGRVQLVCSR
jgi:hypothetical protein